MLEDTKINPIGIGDMMRAKYNSYYKRVVWHEASKDASIWDYTVNSFGFNIFIVL